MKHIHKYERKKFGASIIYKCMLKGCPHYIQKELVEGRTCICSRCNSPFSITKKTLRNCPAKPHCENCYKAGPKDKVLDQLLEILVGD